MKDHIVVQIVSYKTKRHLSDCVDSVMAGMKDSGITFKVLVLENGSGEDIADLEARYENEPVAFYRSGKNLGFGAGHNLLAKKESGEYLFALNPDTVVSKNAIKTLYDFMEAHPEAGLCGPRVEEPIGFWWHKRTFWPKRFTLKSFFEKFLGATIWPNTTALEFNPIAGSALFFRRRAFDEIGGFDENLFLYFEEGDVCNSLKTKQWKIFFVYNAVITHFYYRSDIQPPNAKIFRESRAYFRKKWPQGFRSSGKSRVSQSEQVEKRMRKW
ncbi:MAG TPA: glycosyltransferase family 2 protein [Candidatus Paceibacterota bacterium]|nr:glycosyltransferase family 2 protein [Candidatus Paceibacterota bacterium]